ncbi:hypothetical protein WN943_027906 [Citrus x changshan-huyou]
MENIFNSSLARELCLGISRFLNHEERDVGESFCRWALALAA